MKNALNTLERISLAVLLVLAFVGTMAVGTVAHELSHWNDYKKYVLSDYICLMDMPADGLSSIENIRGTYYYTYDNASAFNQETQTIGKYTEIKAYSIQMVILIVLFFCTTAVVLLKRFSNRYEIQFFKR